jgi:hypothetical protein
MEFGSSGWFDYKEEQEEQEEAAAAAESCRKQQKTHTIWRKRGEMGTIQTTKWYCRIYNLVDWINCRESNQDLVQNLEEEEDWISRRTRRDFMKKRCHGEEGEEREGRKWVGGGFGVLKILVATCCHLRLVQVLKVHTMTQTVHSRSSAMKT